MRILVAEDEQRIASFVEKGLRAAGYSTENAADGRTALLLAKSGEYDLMILDIGLPGLDGFEVLRLLREHQDDTPVIILTARDSVRDTVIGLEGGADDYVTKPFQFAELLARVRLRLRDGGERNRAGADAVMLSHGDITLDLRTRRVDADGRTADLTAREFGLLEVFLRHPGQVLSREQILGHVWGYDFDPMSNVVDVLVRSLRNKVGADHIETVRGAGYRLR